MSEYYAVVRSTDSLMHYGIKGMRWGVRKAIESKNSKALSKQYNKALKKAKKLNTKANISKSKQEYKGRMADAAMTGVTGAALAGGSLGLRSLARANGHHVTAVGIGAGIPFYYDSETSPKYMVPLGAGLAGVGAYHAVKGLAAKHRTTKAGHAKAKAKAESWQSEMKKTFKGTKYAQLPGAKGENKPYGYVPVSTQTKNGMLGAVTSPYYVASKNAVNGSSSKKKKRK